MKSLIVIAMLAIAALAYAGEEVTTYDMGDIKIHRFSDGTTGKTYDMGGMKLHRFSDGTRINTYDMGGVTKHRINEGTGDTLFRDYSAPEPNESLDTGKYGFILDD
jgi:hypothetical protein